MQSIRFSKWTLIVTPFDVMSPTKLVSCWNRIAARLGSAVPLTPTGGIIVYKQRPRTTLERSARPGQEGIVERHGQLNAVPGSFG